MSERIAGTPRSLQEMDFVAGTRACEKCGDQSSLSWANVRSDTVWVTSAGCPSCGTERKYVFSSDEDLTEVVPPELELGASASSVLDAKALQAEIQRLAIKGADFEWDRLERLQTAVNELAKLVEAGRAPGVDGVVLERERARLADLVKARVAARKPDALTATPRGSLDGAAQKAHWDWVQRGRTGQGRLDVVGITATKGKFDGFKAAGARFERVDFRDSNFNLADWSEVELVGCNLNTSSINSTKLVGARIADTTVEGCGGALVNLENANISGSSFTRSQLDGARFVGATVTATSFEQVVFGNARYDGARFQRCDFRGASFEPSRKTPPSTMRGTMFEQCDFRDTNFAGADLRAATFKDCRFEGAHGIPKHAAAAPLTIPMLSASEVLTRPHVIAAVDRLDDKLLAVFDLVGTKAATKVRLVARTAAANADAIRAGIALGVTFGTTGFVWAHDADSFRVWTTEGMPLEVTRSELRMSGIPSPVANVKSIGLLRDGERRGRRGVIVKTPGATPARLVVVQEDDWVASEDPTYADDEIRHEAEWARQLAQDLATWLGVPYDDQQV